MFPKITLESGCLVLISFLSVWTLSWIFNFPDSLNALSHFEQENGLSSVWILSWIFKLPAVVNLQSHFEQLNGFSLVWILSWVFNALERLHL